MVQSAVWFLFHSVSPSGRSRSTSHRLVVDFWPFCMSTFLITIFEFQLFHLHPSDIHLLVRARRMSCLYIFQLVFNCLIGLVMQVFSRQLLTYFRTDPDKFGTKMISKTPAWQFRITCCTFLNPFWLVEFLGNNECMAISTNQNFGRWLLGNRFMPFCLQLLKLFRKTTKPTDMKFGIVVLDTFWQVFCQKILIKIPNGKRM